LHQSFIKSDRHSLFGADEVDDAPVALKAVLLQDLALSTELDAIRLIRSSGNIGRFASLVVYRRHLFAIAVLSGDKAMQKIFKKGLDPHKQTAQAIFQKSEISDDERQIAKTLNYGTIYGGGANMILSNLPNLTEDEARDFCTDFMQLILA